MKHFHHADTMQDVELLPLAAGISDYMQKQNFFLANITPPVNTK
jgi:hypothetical protein